MLDLNVSKITIPDSVAQQIRQLIIDKKLQAGDKLPSQRELAIQLDVGRPAIREALMRLDSMGFVKVKHGHNTIVQKADMESLLINIFPVLEITETDVIPLLEAKEIIEVKCAELAAQRANKDELDRMKAYLDQMEQYREDTEKYAAADYQFHLVIVTSAKNPLINEIMKIVGRMIWKAIEKTALKSQIGRATAMEYHHKIYEAIQAGDGKKAALLVHDHIEETIDRYKKLMEDD